MNEGFIDSRRDAFKFRRIIRTMLDDSKISLEHDEFEDLISYCKDIENVRDIASNWKV